MANRKNSSTQLVLQFGYNGSLFHGVQPQPGFFTVGAALLQRLHQASGEIPHALSFVARTDAGVHAQANLATCRLRTPVPLPILRAAVAAAHQDDGILDLTVGLLPHRVMGRSMGARKHYRYTYVDEAADADAPNRLRAAWPIAPKLDVTKMQVAAQHLVGSHDFSALRDSQCAAKNPHKTIYALQVSRTATGIMLDIHGDSFLRKMVRIIAGTLAEVGCALRSPDSLQSALNSGQRRDAGVTAPARGLTLVAIECAPPYHSLVQGALRPGAARLP